MSQGTTLTGTFERAVSYALHVHGCTDSYEQAKPPWRRRKESYLASLHSKPAEVALVSLADKLNNGRAVLRDHRDLGDALWGRFNAGREDQLWYFRALADAFAA